jgi:hypothetical protein
VSDEKPRPFAEVVAVQQGTRTGFGIAAAGVSFHWPDDRREQASERVAAINAAVEQREARLMAALSGLLRVVINAKVGAFDNGNTHDGHDEGDVLAGRAIDIAHAVLGPNPPDYVPRAELEAERAKVKALQAVSDLLDPRENMTRELVCAYLEANGLRKPEPIDRVAALKALYQDGPPCPKGCGSLGTPSHATEHGRWYGPENATLWCPACGTGWVGSQADVSLAEVAWRAYEALQDLNEA